MNSLLLRSIQLEFETSKTTIEEICEKHQVTKADLKGHTTWKKLIKPSNQQEPTPKHEASPKAPEPILVIEAPESTKKSEGIEEAELVPEESFTVIPASKPIVVEEPKGDFGHLDAAPMIEPEVVEEPDVDLVRQNKVTEFDNEIIDVAKVVLKGVQDMIVNPMMDLTPRDMKDLAATLASLKESVVGKAGPTVNISNVTNQITGYAREQLSSSTRDC